MYVYQKTEPSLWTVGYYDPAGKWQSESDWETPEDAATRAHYLNGCEDDREDHHNATIVEIT